MVAATSPIRTEAFTPPATTTGAAAAAASEQGQSEQVQLDGVADAATATGSDAVSAQAAPADQAASTDQPGDAALWAAVGAGALLLAGGIAMASRRRRSIDGRPIEEGARVIERDEYAPATPPAAIEPVVYPAASQVHAEAQPRTVPVAATKQGSRAELVEAMAAERPSAANPFLTRRNRRRRADFLLRTGADGTPVAAASASTPGAHADRQQPDRYGSFRIGGHLAPRPGRRTVPN